MLILSELFDHRKEWLRHQGSPKSKIEKCEFRDEKNIDSLQFTNFEVRR